MNPQIKDDLFTLFSDDATNFLSDFFYHLFDPGGMDSTILNKAFKRYARDLLAHRVEAGDNHCFRGVVDDYINPGKGFKGPNIPSLAADNPSLHLIGGKTYRTDGNIVHNFSRQP